MAKVGEGDPRWVVSDRVDGTNVNNWHWSGERDLSSWADSRLSELLTPISGSSSRVSKLENVEGDATMYNRKNNLKVVFDLKVSGEWESVPPGTKGTFSFELFDEEPEVSACVSSKEAENPNAKTDFVSQCVPQILHACKKFCNEISEGGDMAGKHNLQVNRRSEADSSNRQSELSVMDFKHTPGVDASSAEVVARERTDSAFTITDIFNCSPKDLFQAIAGDRARLEAVTRARAVLEPKVGGKWEVLGGAARGVFREILPSSRAVMDWRMQNWDDSDKDVELRMDFRPHDGRTQLTIAIRGMPESRRSAVEGFWRVQILQAVKVIFGYGSAAFL